MTHMTLFLLGTTIGTLLLIGLFAFTAYKFKQIGEHPEDFPTDYNLGREPGPEEK